ncbi:MAG: TrbC/VirB2 family protein [Polyangiaceae bacterium]|nr:TrbC/VirB2 family protein [Polyangiaceae bacterium]
MSRQRFRDLDPAIRLFAVSLLCLTAFLVLSPAAAHAAFGSGMPWEGPMDQLLSSVQGPVARVLGATALISCGVGFAFGEGGHMMRKALWVVLGLAITFNAASWGLGFLGFSGGILV